MRSRWRVSRSAASTSAIGRVQLGGQLELDQGPLELIRRGEPAAGEEVLLGCPELGALQRAARVAVLGVEPDGGGVLDDRPVVVLRLLGALAGAERELVAQPQTAQQAEAHQQRGRAGAANQRPGEPAWMTSAPRGMVNSKRLIGRIRRFP